MAEALSKYSGSVGHLALEGSRSRFGAGRWLPRATPTALLALSACQIDLGGPSAPVEAPATIEPVTSTGGAGPSSPPGSGLPNQTGAGAPGGGGGSTSSTPAATGGVGGGAPVSAAECTVRGRWLVTQRNGVSVPSPRVDQALHSWFYYELEQSGPDLRVTKGLDCGYRLAPLPPPPAPTLAGSGDASGAWAGILQRDTHTGRTGRITVDGSECLLHLDTEYTIRGATASYYSDPARPLPASGLPAATATSPGWEDWDADGKPGITIRVDSVLVRGAVHIAGRESSVYDGRVPAGADTFKVPVRWTSEQVTLSTDPPNDAFLATTSSVNADPNSHYAYFLALGAAQGLGTDAEICEEMRTLASTLPAEANQ
jgi:hypothetical protein